MLKEVQVVQAQELPILHKVQVEIIMVAVVDNQNNALCKSSK
jgi:hypothetical protein